ncbi:MAG: methyltransferase domain-containing protein [Promethearchaeota archaeon]
MKLNIGCGKKYEIGYCNIDLYETLIADKLMSAIDLQFEDNCCKEIKAIHLIEHLSFFEAIYALSEFFRVLKPGGKLIIETPDLKKVCQHYLDSTNEQKKEILGWIYGIPHKGLQHKLCFPPFLLIELLENNGFENMSTKSFYNHEFIPSVRFECIKPMNEYETEIFQIIAKIRKKLLTLNYSNFNDSLSIKEQEDLLSFIAIQTLEFKRKKNKKLIYDLIIESLIKWPQIVNLLLKEIESKYFISQSENSNIREITDLLIQHNFPNILYNLLKKGPINSGSQKIVFHSIESFARKFITNLIVVKEERENLIDKLRNLSKENEDYNLKFFASALAERSAFNFFYLGIKLFYQKNYKKANNMLLKSIQLYRDNFLFYWNLGKVLAKLKSNYQAMKIYKKALRLLRMTNVRDKGKIKSVIKDELNWIKGKKGIVPKFEPVPSIGSIS